MKLLIVESPSKSKTIKKYLGNGYTVKSSVGHIRDLPKSNKKAIDIKNDFKPLYETIAGKEDVIKDLNATAKKSTEILLATDLDREGEAIAWHIKEALADIPNSKFKRITFNEITQEAIQEALKHPRRIDQNLRKAQEARRVLDRLFGYDLSGLIWKKVRYGLSAGRVQSPALRIIVEREREIKAFIPEKFWTISADVKNEKNKEFTLICSEEPRDEQVVKRILKTAKKEKWSVLDVKETQAKRAPRAPFITSTLQQTASSRFGFAPSKTMFLAQRLYESGHITYMRTDSITLSSSAQKQIIETVRSKFGEKYLEPRNFKSKSKNAQEAHEAIRPTKFSNEEVGANAEQKKLYKLIWQRAVASQMKDAQILRTKIIANTESKTIPDFSINGSRILFDGWLTVDPISKKDDVSLPEVSIGEKLDLLKIDTQEKETLPPPRYTEAGLVKELEKREIGRPSTYAAIIRTLKDRKYVELEGRALKPTDTGEVVSTFLEKNFENYISDSFTAEMENELDEIANGKKEYAKILKKFYGPFTKDIEAKEDLKKITDLGKADAKFKCPVCKGPMIIKLGKTGKFMSCKKFPKCTGARTIEGKELEGPKETGEKCPKCEDGKLVEREGKFGKFISCSNYPKCKFIKEDPKEAEKKKTGVTCPVCGKGDMSERRGRFGIFYSCSEYPTCKYAIKAKPTGKLCSFIRKDKDGKKCGALMMEGTKTIPERCSDKTCPNHNPHKLEKK
ncbi:MAG: type I DNA topoisomerase [Candidatus Moranbacteria bacterium]|nr:type I DNA topoisomerase [Candidatus Moranbacteria bacterium]